MHTKTCQNYLWPVLRCTICHIKVPSRLPAPPALGLSISLLAINNVEHRHDKPGDEEVILVTRARTCERGPKCKSRETTTFRRRMDFIQRAAAREHDRARFFLTPRRLLGG